MATVAPFTKIKFLDMVCTDCMIVWAQSENPLDMKYCYVCGKELLPCERRRIKLIETSVEES